MPYTPEGLPADHHFKPEWEVTPRHASDALRAGKALVLDVRLETEWDFARVHGSHHIPLDELEARADEIRDLAAAQPGPVLALCHHGVRSLKAAAFLRHIGLTDAKSIAGGIEAWSVAIDASVPRYERQGSSVWPARNAPK